jgi:hypothetical protein
MSGSVAGRLGFMLLAAAVAGLFAVAPRQACAQAVGEITGTVTDPSGAVVPHVHVTATNQATGISQSTFTTSAGAYTIPHLLVGTYTVTAQESGFKSGVAPGVTLNVGQVREVNFKLAVGSTKQTVTVTGLPALLDTTNNSLGTTLSAEEVQDLPLYGRDFTDLVETMPGMVANPTGSMGWFTGGSWVSNGNRVETDVATMDGGDTSDMEMGDTTLTNFNLDAISQIKVLQNDYSAQYGQGGGSVIEAVSASGTNQFHGSAFDYVTNSAFDARNFFSTSVPVFTYNQFGATFGGPIKKNKTFFFGSWTALRQRETSPSQTEVPTEAERNGTILEGTDMLQVPLNPVSKTILGRYPLPNDPSGIYGVGTFYWDSPSNVNDNQYSGRVDQYFSAKDDLFARATVDNFVEPDNDSFAVEEGGPTFAGNDEHLARDFMIGETHILSPTLLNTFDFTLVRTIQGDSVAPASLTIPDTSISGFTGWGPRTFYTEYVTTTFEPTDRVNWTTGRNSFTFGGNFRREWDNGSGVTSLGPGGVFYFNPGTLLTAAIPSENGGASLSAGTPSPSGLISMMEGDAYQYGRALSAPGYGPPGGGAVWWGLRRWTMAAYAQDFLKATRRLTLGFGLRYEYYSVPSEIGDRLSGPADYGSLYGNMVVNPQPLWQPDYVSGDFGPRFSFAENLGRNTALRGGFGIFTNAIPTIYADQSLVDFPVESLNYITNPTYSLTPEAVSLPYLTSLSGQPLAENGNTKTVPPNTPVNLSPLVPILGQFSGDYASDRMRNGYTMQANMTLEHEFAGGVAAQASWVNSTGVSLTNQAYPNAFAGAEPQYTPYSNITDGALGELAVFYNGAHSDYNALQLEARKVSAAHGLTFDVNYTWGKAMSDADDLFEAPSYSQAMNNPTCLKCEYAPGYFSVSQRFNADFIYNLPISEGLFSRLPRRLMQGWKIAGIFQAQTGFPVNINTQYGSLPYGYDDYTGEGARPDLLKTPTPGPKTQGPIQFFSNAVIGNNNGQGTGYFGQTTTISPVPGVGEVLVSPGNLGRDTFTSPAWSNFDFSLIKDTRITESKTLQFRAEFYNIFNQATFGMPNSTLGGSGFGLIGSTATTQRYIQFALRFIF